MRALRTEIKIAAPIENVWKVLTDFDGWKDWNPIFKASGAAKVGTKLKVTVGGDDCKEGKSFQPQVTQVEAPSEFRWRGTMMAGFLFTNDKIFKLEKSDKGTKLIHCEEFSGLMVPLVWKKMNEFALPMLESMNEALKKKLESSTR